MEREEYFTVKEIISPTLVKLTDGREVRLLGIKEKKAANGEATEFLTQKAKGRKVYLRFDEQKFDDQKRPLCYLYLKNRTFLNAHLIKNGLAEVDTAAEFRHKAKFLKLKQNT